MQNWQKERNYRKYTNEDGTSRYVITVDGTDVDVSEEVYLAYSQADRRERYQTERDTGRVLSLERMDEDGVLLPYLADAHAESSEDEVLRKMDAAALWAAMDSLTPDERRLIDALILDGVTEREYAAHIGIAQKNVNKKKQRILQKLKKFFMS